MMTSSRPAGPRPRCGRAGRCERRRGRRHSRPRVRRPGDGLADAWQQPSVHSLTEGWVYV
eukprot:5845209-Prymnesium_polylepis.1